MVQPRRLARIEKRIQQKIAQVLLRDASDPRLGFVTITRVQVDPEIQICKVYWSVLGDEKERRLNDAALQHARKFIQHEVAEILDTRTVPTLEFHFDESIQGAERISAILREIDEERQGARLNPEAQSGEAPDAPSDEEPGPETARD